jgi:peptidoglycan/LPS O-acetylase OafA/YrhL
MTQISGQSTEPAVSSTNYRPALDGVRAIAVLVVIAFHLGFKGVSGGFLGVDMFFVLSGYLVTGLLVDEYRRSQTIAFSKFWLRRVRRLFPALFIVLTALCIFAFRYGAPEDNYGLRRDSLATLFYSANWWYIKSGQSYFAQFANVSPLRHTWSLAIEEQFYFFWPLLVLIVLKLSKGRLRNLAVIAGVGSIASAVSLAAHWELIDQSRSYYGTDTRIHEMFIGAIAAMVLRTKFASRHKGRAFWSWVSPALLVVIVLSVVKLTDSTHAYYTGYSALFSVVVATFLLSLDLGEGFVKRILSLKPVVFIGLISYGLYLWHWPIIVLVVPGAFRISRNIEHGQLIALQIALMFILSFVSYKLVEKPIRAGSILKFTLTGRRTAVSFLCAMTLMSAMIVQSTANQAIPAWAVQVDPGTFRVMGDQATNAPTLAIVGDSIAKSMLGGLDKAGKAAGVRIIAGAWSGCGVGSGYQLDEDGKTPFIFSQSCHDAVPSSYRTLIEKYNPQAVYWHSVRERFPQKLADGTVLMPRTPAHNAQVLANYKAAYDILHSRGATVLVSTVVLRARRFKGSCHQFPSRCGPDLGTDGIYAAMNALSRTFVAQTPGTKLVDISPIICPGGAPCPTYVHGVMLRYDGSHLTAKGTLVVGNDLLALFLKSANIAPLRPKALILKR